MKRKKKPRKCANESMLHRVSEDTILEFAKRVSTSVPLKDVAIAVVYVTDEESIALALQLIDGLIPPEILPEYVEACALTGRPPIVLAAVYRQAVTKLATEGRSAKTKRAVSDSADFFPIVTFDDTGSWVQYLPVPKTTNSLAHRKITPEEIAKPTAAKLHGLSDEALTMLIEKKRARRQSARS